MSAENENEEHKTYMNNTQKRMTKMSTKSNQAMKTGGVYTGPTIITHAVEKSGNNCVITNETHCKATNNGFNRSESGRFFCH